ncbi:MAG TPA: aspartate carbamoyltransferase regulatory subunit, partial [Thermoproteota archaeon]|nr:aspartate carbamoyltransferase regulatory subunit [Thermoproteota archaeon]
MPQEELRVAKIRNGTVIDHIPAGKALQVIRILGIKGTEGHIATILMNVPSLKLGKKDLVKIEDMT